MPPQRGDLCHGRTWCGSAHLPRCYLQNPGRRFNNNDLNIGTWIDIFFGGDIPYSITGQITDKIEDMIEIINEGLKKNLINKKWDLQKKLLFDDLFNSCRCMEYLTRAMSRE